MKNSFFSSRYKQLLAALLLLAILLVLRLLVLTIGQHKEWSDPATNISTRTIYTTAPRGEIFDRYGRLVAGEEQSFSVRISGTDQSDKEINQTISALIDILEKNGDSYVGEFPIAVDDGKYTFIYKQEIEDWLTAHGLSTTLTAEEAFNALRSNLRIDPSLDRYDAQLEMQNTYNQYPPISVVDMKYTAEMEKAKFLEQYFPEKKGIEKKSAKAIFNDIRKEMGIDGSLSDEEALKIMTVRNEMESGSLGSYIPVVVGKGLSDSSVMEMEEAGDLLKGVEIVSEPTRYYPNGATASHIIGYMGKISDTQMEKYKDRGYESGAIIGQNGIEGVYENVLKGQNGEKKIQVNAQGQFQQVISETEQKKGQDVYLTIDLELQKFAEETLENTITAMQTGSQVDSPYGSLPTVKAAPNAKTGAVVVLEVETGDVLALASYPDYDPNLFTQGISEEDWSSLQSSNPRDPLAPAALYNNATMSAIQPGSTFKPLTALVALECGLNPEEHYLDKGKLEMGGRIFGCVAWTLYKGNHGYINLARALEVSCNYYFFDIATGMDWATNKSLGYDKDISLDMITDYAEQFGLGKSTGIEIDETVIPVPSEERKVEGLSNSFGFTLYANAEEYFNEKVVKNSELLDKNIETMKGWMSQPQVSWNELYYNMLPDMGIKEDQRTRVGELFLYDLYPQAKWQVSDSFNIGIGQGENAYTPLQIANYIATLGAKGTHNQVRLVKSVEDEGPIVKEQPNQVKITDAKNYDYVIEGMKMAATGPESAERGIYTGLPYEVALKTGTAERTGKINPLSEVKYIQKNLSSLDPDLSWDAIEDEMDRLMKEYPDTYTTKDVAVRRAVINLSDKKLTNDSLDVYKEDYAEFAWIVAMAPADDPQIVVCAMVPQGSTSGNVAPIPRNIFSKYFDLESNYKELSVENVVQ